MFFKFPISDKSDWLPDVSDEVLSISAETGPSNRSKRSFWVGGMVAGETAAGGTAAGGMVAGGMVAGGMVTGRIAVGAG